LHDLLTAQQDVPTGPVRRQQSPINLDLASTAYTWASKKGARNKYSRLKESLKI